MSLLDLLNQATEFHDLTVVKMAIRDLENSEPESSALDRLRVDMDKMRMAETPEGKALYQQIKNDLMDG